MIWEVIYREILRHVSTECLPFLGIILENISRDRSLGDFYMQPFVSEEPHLVQVELTQEDEFLILACDGVWDEITDQEAVNIIARDKNPFEASFKLRNYAYMKGSDDNIR